MAQFSQDGTTATGDPRPQNLNSAGQSISNVMAGNQYWNAVKQGNQNTYGDPPPATPQTQNTTNPPTSNANNPAQPQALNATTPPSWTTDPQYAGMDPSLKQIYLNSGQTPEGRGTGFADWQYWQGVGPSQYGRLASDIAGTGSDQTTGTPWASGSWQSSGSSPSSVSTSTITPTFLPIQNNLQIGQGDNALSLNNQNQNIVNLLANRANQSLNIDPTTDSIIQPQVSDYSAAQTRQNRQALNQMAESTSPYSTGAVNTAATQLAENASQNTANMQASLVQNELAARRTEIQNALSEMGSMLTSDQQMQLQQQLGLIDASIQRQSVANQYTLGQGQLANQLTLGEGQLGLGQQQINSNNDQFAANYGLNANNQNNYWSALQNGLITG